jgi:hypothetical protein
MIALAVAQAVAGLCSDRHFLGAVGRSPGYLPQLPDQSQLNRRLRLPREITAGQLMVAELLDPSPFFIPCARLRRCIGSAPGPFSHGL